MLLGTIELRNEEGQYGFRQVIDPILLHHNDEWQTGLAPAHPMSVPGRCAIRCIANVSRINE